MSDVFIICHVLSTHFTQHESNWFLQNKRAIFSFVIAITLIAHKMTLHFLKKLSQSINRAIVLLVVMSTWCSLLSLSPVCFV